MAASLPGRVLRKFMEDQAPKQAVLIAWNLMFAAFPIVVTIAAVLGLVLSFSGLNALQVQGDLLAMLPQGSGSAVLDPLKQKTGLLFVVGLLGLVWTGTALFGAIEEAFAIVYHCKPRGFLAQKRMSLGMMLLFTVFTALIVGTAAALPALQHLPYFPAVLASGPLALVLQVIFGTVAGCVLFTIIYFVVPHLRLSLRRVLPGAIGAGLLLETLTFVFPLYLKLNKGVNQFGPQFGFLFILLTFFYFLAMVLMLGVEINATLDH
ncbi:MAG: YihY/virulence factor BrkB family protein [Candidatus Dormibacteria bacterium]